jgi:hypothetical protein
MKHFYLLFTCLFFFGCQTNGLQTQTTSTSQSKNARQDVPNPKIARAENLLQAYGYQRTKADGFWESDSRQAVKELYLREKNQRHQGEWNETLLSDLEERKLISFPLQSGIEVASENKALRNYNFLFGPERVGNYRAGNFGFTVVESTDIGPGYCYPKPTDCAGETLFTVSADNFIAADFNADGREDLAVSWMYFPHHSPRADTPSHIRFYINDGKGNLVSTPSIYAENIVPIRHMIYRLVSEDFNGDGYPDLFGGTMGAFYSKPNTPTISQREPQVLLLSNGKGQLYDASSSLPGQESGGITPGFHFAHASASGDLNCDGHQDIYSGGLFFAGDGTGKFRDLTQSLPKIFRSELGSSSRHFTAAVIADINQDGCDDLIGSDFDGLQHLWVSSNGEHKNRRLLKARIKHEFGNDNMRANYAAAGDLDNDGQKEVVFSIHPLEPYYQGRKLAILKFDGKDLVDISERVINDSRYLDTPDRGKASGEGSLVIVDHDGDSDLDIIDTSGYNWNSDKPGFTFDIFENDGDGNFTLLDQENFLIPRRRGLGYTISVDIDGVGVRDYVSFFHSSYNPERDVLYGFTVYGE